MRFTLIFRLSVAKIAILWLMALLPGFSLAQSPVADSLRVRLAKSPATEKSKVCNELAYEFLGLQIDSTRKYAQLAFEWAQKQHQVKNEAQANFSLGYCFEMEEDYLGALEKYNLSFELYSSINDLNGIASVANYIGTIYKYTGHYETSAQYYNTALKFYTQLNDYTGMAYTYNNIGVLNYNTGQYDKAQETYLKCLEYSKMVKDTASMSSVYNNLGLLAFSDKKFTKALNLYKLSLELSRLIDDKSGIATSYSNIADVLVHEGKYEEALNYLDMVEMINPVEFSGTIRANSFLNQADIYEKMNQSDKAELYFEKAISLSTELNLRPIRANACYDFARFLSSKNRDAEAAGYLFTCVALRDSIHTDDLARQISNTDFNVEFNEKKLEIQSLKKQREIDQLQMQVWKWVFAIAIAAALIILILLFVLFRKLKNTAAQKVQLEKKNNEIVQLNNELTILRDRLDGNLQQRTLELRDEKQRRVGMEKDLAVIRQERDQKFLVSSMLRRHVGEEIQSSVDLIRDSSAHISGLTDNNEWQTMLDHISFNARHIQFSLQELMVLDGDQETWKSKCEGQFTAVQLLTESEKYFRRLVPGANLSLKMPEKTLPDCRGDKNLGVRLINDAIILLYRNSVDHKVLVEASADKSNLRVSVSAHMDDATIGSLTRYSSIVADLHAETSDSISDIDIVTPLYYLHVFSGMAGASYSLSSDGTYMFIRFSFQAVLPKKQETIRPYTFSIAGNDDPINTILLSRSLEPYGVVSLVEFKEFTQSALNLQEQKFDGVFIDVPTDQIREFSERIGELKMASPKTIFVAMSAYLLPEDRDRLLNAGFDYCLAKPLSNNALQRFFEKLMK